jgi:hypothetical protein
VSNAILQPFDLLELDGQDLGPLDFGAFAWRRKRRGSWLLMATVGPIRSAGSQFGLAVARRRMSWMRH